MNPDILSALVTKIFSLEEKSTEGIFVHAWNDLRSETLDYIGHLYQQFHPRYIILNGLEHYELDRPGFSYWKDVLIKDHGVPEEIIIPIAPAVNTGEEARNLMDLVKEKNILSLGIVSVPMHIVRAFLSDLAAMNEKNLDLDITCLVPPSVNWFAKIEINHTSGGPKETTIRLGRFAAEIARIIEYNKAMLGGDKRFIVASPEEGLKYLQRKENG